jgi:exonuclease V gamma subunit
VLAHWGRAQRDFGVQVMNLAEQCGVAIDEPLREQDHPFADPDAPPPAAPGCLQALQLSVFLASDSPWARCAGPDRSLQILATHGLVRSAEVLHDALLECFDEIPDLQPHEVAVCCADLDAALPALQAVFASAPGGRAIPVSISGRRATADPLLRAMLDLWALARLGVPLPSLARWLDNPVLMHTLAMDDDEIARLLELFDAAGARWGMTPERGPAGTPGAPRSTGCCWARRSARPANGSATRFPFRVCAPVRANRCCTGCASRRRSNVSTRPSAWSSRRQCGAISPAGWPVSCWRATIPGVTACSVITMP